MGILRRAKQFIAWLFGGRTAQVPAEQKPERDVMQCQTLEPRRFF